MKAPYLIESTLSAAPAYLHSPMLMQIFFPGRQAAPDMPLGLIYVQNLPGLSRETGINMQQAFCHILMYSCR